MKRLLALVCVLGLALLAGCAEPRSYDYDRVMELARAELLPEGADVSAERAVSSGDRVTAVIEYESEGKSYRAEATYRIADAYPLLDKTLVPVE